ncbi:hypothetical protein RND81_01G190600 [Saponaria officinalis]|uniref:Protein kinase domain-containing protein n=1 Tax=Saponaria officinalis TaxID=3572 RepID=A0AAW1NHB2_SAPOF
MEQLRHIGAVIGSMKAMMIFKDDIQLNQKQCCFILDAFTLAFETISEEMRRNLKFEDNQTTWKGLEHPLKELHRISKEAEAYVRSCFEVKDFWAKALISCQNRDCVELHIYNLLSCVPGVLEAIESATELSSWSREYHREWNDPKLFEWKFGKKYLITMEMCNKIDAVWKEDRWCLIDKIREKKVPRKTKYSEQLVNLLLKNLESLDDKILPSSVLLGSKDYHVKRRFGAKGECKEISWLGETFVIRQIKGNNVEFLVPELSHLLSLSHPNILPLLCGFKDEEKDECFVITEMVNKDLVTYVKEFYNPKKNVSVSMLVVVDIMLQIARGMEYLHCKKIFHGDLNPSNIFVKTTGASPHGYVHAKVANFGLSSLNTNTNETLSCIWYAPEVLAAQEEFRRDGEIKENKYSEKSDVYSFGMICFELLSGKLPFDDAHLQGEKMSRNIRAGERPLFPSNCPKFMMSITKKCWHSDPNQRPTFSSICRVLRYIKRFLVMNPDDVGPQVDYWEIESALLKKFPSWSTGEALPVSEIPFQMFAYRVTERERCTSYESCSEGTSISGDEHAAITADDPFISVFNAKIATPDEKLVPGRRSLDMKPSRYSLDTKPIRYSATPKWRSLRPPQLTRYSRSLQSSPDNRISQPSPRKWRKSGHASDSEIS